jgi:hypothetical protein
MIQPGIKYDFKQLLTALTAIVADMELKLQSIMVDLPVFVLQTGDTSYWMTKKFEKIEISDASREIYNKTPRFIITVGDFDIALDQLSSKYNKLTYKYSNSVYMTSFRRMPFTVILQTSLVCPNFIDYLENMMVLNSLFYSRENYLTYEFGGSTYDTSYNYQNPGKSEPDMNAGSTRNFTINTSFECKVHVSTPRVETIKLLDTSGDSVVFDVTEKDGEDNSLDMTYQVDSSL